MSVLKSPYRHNGRNVVATLASSFLIGSSSFIAGIEGNHKRLFEFEFLPDLTTTYRVSCPWVSEQSMYIFRDHSTAFIFFIGPSCLNLGVSVSSSRVTCL